MAHRWKGVIQLVFGIGITVLFFYMMAPFVVATLIGAVIAIVCYPLHERLEKKLRATLSALILTTALTVGVLLPIIFFLYVGSFKLLALISTGSFPENPTAPENILTYGWIHKILATIGEFFPIDELWLKTQAISVIQNVTTNVSKFLAASLAGMPTVMVGILVIILSTFFFLVDGKRFLRFLSELSPLRHQRSVQLFHVFETSCRGVVIGLFAAGLLQGVLMAIFFAITGLPNPLLVGALSVGMGMVPLVGTAPIWIGAVIYLFLQGSTGMMVVMLAGGVLISLSDNGIRALIMHGQTSIHPFLALVSVFGAINLVGASGIFLGPIIAAVFVSFLKIIAQEIRAESYSVG